MKCCYEAAKFLFHNASIRWGFQKYIEVREKFSHTTNFSAFKGIVNHETALDVIRLQFQHISIGGSRGHCRPPTNHQQDPILLFSYAFLPKSTHIGGWHPPPQWLGTPQLEILDPPQIRCLQSILCTKLLESNGTFLSEQVRPVAHPGFPTEMVHQPMGGAPNHWGHQPPTQAPPPPRYDQDVPPYQK